MQPSTALFGRIYKNTLPLRKQPRFKDITSVSTVYIKMLKKLKVLEV